MPTAAPISYASVQSRDGRSRVGKPRKREPVKIIESLYRNFGAAYTIQLALASVVLLSLGFSYLAVMGISMLGSAFSGQPVASPHILAAGAVAFLVAFPAIMVPLALWFGVLAISVGLMRRWLGKGGSPKTDIFTATAMSFVNLTSILALIIIGSSPASKSVVAGNVLGAVLALGAYGLMFRVVFEALRDLAQIKPWPAAAATIGVLLTAGAAAGFGIYFLPLLLRL